MPETVGPVTGLNLLDPHFIENEMDLQLQGKLALVTGSTAGIGFAIRQSLDSIQDKLCKRPYGRLE